MGLVIIIIGVALLIWLLARLLARDPDDGRKRDAGSTPGGNNPSVPLYSGPAGQAGRQSRHQYKPRSGPAPARRTPQRVYEPESAEPPKPQAPPEPRTAPTTKNRKDTSPEAEPVPIVELSPEEEQRRRERQRELDELAETIRQRRNERQGGGIAEAPPGYVICFNCGAQVRRRGRRNRCPECGTEIVEE
ncbi:MAG: hypothetical protein GF403_04450 [Candidatus Coatesbacteria bacterium]|nr:hypothetical protein [Candidatus Coatesbacteria bacterium]